MPLLPPDDVLLQLSLRIAADRIATDPWLRESLTEQLPPQYASTDPAAIVSRLRLLEGAKVAKGTPHAYNKEP